MATHTRGHGGRLGAAVVAGGLAWLVGCAEPTAGGDDDDGTDVSTGADTSGTTEGEGSGRPIPVDLVWPELWVEDLAADATPAHAPPTVECSLGWGDEFGLFEVDTGLCNYGVFSQPLAAEIFEGERVEFVFTHDDLLAPEPAVTHIEVALDGQVVWGVELAIPKAYDIVQGEWLADAPVAAGAVVSLHLHNHGYNNYRVVSMKAGMP